MNDFLRRVVEQRERERIDKLMNEDFKPRHCERCSKKLYLTKRPRTLCPACESRKK